MVIFMKNIIKTKKEAILNVYCKEKKGESEDKLIARF